MLSIPGKLFGKVVIENASDRMKNGRIAVRVPEGKGACGSDVCVAGDVEI